MILCAGHGTGTLWISGHAWFSPLPAISARGVHRGLSTTLRGGRVMDRFHRDALQQTLDNETPRRAVLGRLSAVVMGGLAALRLTAPAAASPTSAATQA